MKSQVTELQVSILFVAQLASAAADSKRWSPEVAKVWDEAELTDGLLRYPGSTFLYYRLRVFKLPDHLHRQHMIHRKAGRHVLELGITADQKARAD